MIENDFAAINVKIPPSLKERLSNKTVYSAKTFVRPLIRSSYVCSNIVASVVTNIYICSPNVAGGVRKVV